ncbi:MAG: alpha/beta fold hydrolase, partial [Actinobacteria bacterium]|nr:alpha/beta fold hydrolase [Actinomycetota bacterium]
APDHDRSRRPHARYGAHECPARATFRARPGYSRGRRAVQDDPNFNGGDYYDAPPGAGPHVGLKLARQIAQIHYRSDDAFSNKFGRSELDRLDGPAGFTLDGRFDVEGYLDYHGDKLVRRFDANSYVRLNKAMDLHDLARKRGSVQAALNRVSAPSLIMSISSDTLYPPYQQEAIRDGLLAAGKRCGFYEIDSSDGHDGFLIELNQIGGILAGFLDAVLVDTALHDLALESR